MKKLIIGLLLLVLLLAACSAQEAPASSDSQESEKTEEANNSEIRQSEDTEKSNAPAVREELMEFPKNTKIADFQLVESIGQTAFDTSDKRLTVGFADYVFIGTVVSLDKVKYTYEEDGELDNVRTLISVRVEENIKGQLVKDKAIQFWYRGGPTKQTDAAAESAGLFLPNPGTTYVFQILADKDNELINPGAGSIITVGSREKLTDEEFGKKYESMRLAYIEAYKNEDTTYHRKEYYPSRYDVNYKGE
ncbi:MAG: hypothetical protein II794_00065 [Oscillospiraceae bacterium]|nr:hypothetical protein [Oscillospiraceae bacterium]